LASAAAEPFGNADHALRRVGTAVEHDVLAGLAQLGLDRLVDRELAGVDDAHVHARLYRVIQEHRVHRFAHRLVAAERERQIGDAAGDVAVGQFGADLPRRLDEIDAVVVVLLDAGADREHVGIEDDVLGREIRLFDQQFIGPSADRHLARAGVGLPLFVERHHHDRGAIGAHQLGLTQEFGLAFLHRDRIDDPLALHAFQAGLDDREFRGIDHDWHARDVRLGGDEVEELDHRRRRIDEALVHIDVDDLGAVGDLIARHHQRAGEIA